MAGADRLRTVGIPQTTSGRKNSAVRRIQQGLQANRQRCRKSRGPTLVNQTNTEQIEQVNLVLAAEGRQLDAHQGLERNQAKRAHFNRFSNIRARSLFAFHDQLAREHDTNSVPRAAACIVEKQIKPRGMPVDESGPFHRRLRPWKVSTTNQYVNILRVSGGRLIDRCDPGCDRASADQRIRDGIRFQHRTSFQEALSHLFYGVSHPLQEQSGTGNRRWHAEVYAKSGPLGRVIVAVAWWQ